MQNINARIRNVIDSYKFSNPINIGKSSYELSATENIFTEIISESSETLGNIIIVPSKWKIEYDQTRRKVICVYEVCMHDTWQFPSYWGTMTKNLMIRNYIRYYELNAISTEHTDYNGIKKLIDRVIETLARIDNMPITCALKLVCSYYLADLVKHDAYFPTEYANTYSHIINQVELDPLPYIYSNFEVVIKRQKLTENYVTWIVQGGQMYVHELRTLITMYANASIEGTI